MEDSFRQHVLDEVIPTLRIHDPDWSQAVGERILADILALEGPTAPIGPPPDARKLFLNKVVGHLSDIDAALLALRMAAVFCRQFPTRATYAKRGVTESAYLKYHVEHYWQELFRLRESLITLVRVVTRHAARQAQGERRRQTREHGEQIVKAVSDGFEAVSGVRGRLVHQARYRDADLDRMDTLDLILNGLEDEDRETFQHLHQAIYREKRASAADEIEAMTTSVELQIEKVYAELDRLLYPNSADAAG